MYGVVEQTFTNAPRAHCDAIHSAYILRRGAAPDSWARILGTVVDTGRQVSGLVFLVFYLSWSVLLAFAGIWLSA